MSGEQDGNGARAMPVPTTGTVPPADSEELDLAAGDLFQSIAAETVPDQIIWLAQRLAAELHGDMPTDPAEGTRD